MSPKWPSFQVYRLKFGIHRLSPTHATCPAHIILIIFSHAPQHTIFSSLLLLPIALVLAIMQSFEKEIYSSVVANTLPKIRVSIFTAAASLTSICGNAVHSALIWLLAALDTEQFRFAGLMNCGWLQQDRQTYWLPVKDNWNRGTKMEERDKRKNKGRMKPVTVRQLLPQTAWKVLLWVQNPIRARKYLYMYLCLYSPV